MTEFNEQVVRNLRVVAYLMEHYGNAGTSDSGSIQVVDGDVTLFGNFFASAMLRAGATAGDWYGPRTRRQRTITFEFHGVKLRGYEVVKSEPTGFDPAAAGFDVEPTATSSTMTDDSACPYPPVMTRWGLATWQVDNGEWLLYTPGRSGGRYIASIGDEELSVWGGRDGLGQLRRIDRGENPMSAILAVLRDLDSLPDDGLDEDASPE